MKNKWLLAAVIVLMQLALVASPAEAVTVTSFSPTSVSNALDTILTISGTDFLVGAVVKVGDTDLSTDFVDATTLEATVPSGFAIGVYTVSVTNPSMAPVTAAGQLTVYSPTPTPPPGRPIVVISSYYTDPADIDAGTNFTLFVELKNKGALNARNLMMSFSGTGFSPLNTGGVIAKDLLKAGKSGTVSQSFYVESSLWGYVMQPLQATVNYTDDNNVSYTETFNISVGLAPVPYIKPSATPTVNVTRPRLLVTKANTDIAVLQPGSQFQLFMDIANVGSETARSVNMVVGGATVEAPTGTDTPGGGYSATGGDFTNFSPLGGSNVQALGDIAVGSTFTASQPLIVNVTTNPGAYTLKISLVYLNSKGETLVDDQVITLLVKSVPMIDISFYRDPGDLFTFQPNALPIQIVNIGKKSAILGSMKITSSTGMVDNGTLQVGYLDAGGYLTQDAMLTPETTGEVTITITVDYVDDFNQPQEIIKELSVNVVEMPPMETPTDAGMGEQIEQPAAETFWQKVLRFIKGLIGLDSSPNQNQLPGATEFPVEEIPIDGENGTSNAVPIKGP